jgi:hypothetical protein
MLSLNGNLYALLIAIDTYSDPIPALRGCVRDSEDVEAWLKASVPEEKLNIKRLHNHDATKQNVIDGFLKHLTQAGPEDTVLVHYSGHGSQEIAPAAFAKLEPDGYNETLVCVDSRHVINGVLHRDLADKELGALIKKVADTGAHVLTIFDCCHSGSGTRDTEEVTPRQSPSDKHKARTLDDYIFMDERSFGIDYKQAIEGQEAGFARLPEGRHVLLAGSRSRQTAKELRLDDGRTGGIFTYALLDVLKRSQGRVTYRDLVARARTIVNNRVADQDPQLDLVAGGSANDFFLGVDGVAQMSDYYMMHYRPDLDDWVVQAGELHGVTKGEGEDAAVFNVFSEAAGPEDKPFMTAVVTKVEQAYSHVDFMGEHSVFGNDMTFKAKLVQAPPRRIRVRFEAEEPNNIHQQQAVEGLIAMLSHQPADINVPPADKFVEVVGEGEAADYRIYCYHHNRQERMAVYREADNTPLIDQLTGFFPQNFLEMGKRLSAIARWNHVSTLTNASTQINANDLEVIIEIKHRDPLTEEWSEPERMVSVDEVHDLEFYEYDLGGGEKGISPEIRIGVQNNSTRRTYYCALYYLISNFGIMNLFRNQIGEHDEAKVEEIGPGQTQYALWGSFITPDVDEGLRKMGLKRDVSLLKLIGSTVDFNGATLEQEGFDYPQTMRDIGGENSAVMAAMGDIRTRGGLKIRRSVKTTDWTTKLVRLNSIYTGSSEDERRLAMAGVEVERPEGMSFDVALGSSSTGSRSTDGMAVPAALLANGRPLTYVQGRSTSPSLDTIELRNVENPEAITKENPIKLRFSEKLQEGESLVVVSREDGLFIPSVAQQMPDGSTELHITSLNPEMAATGERGIGRTFKLLVHKLVAPLFGKKFPFPKLGVASIGKDGKAEYDYDPEAVKAAMENACDIVCVVHGYTSEVHECFFGETDGTEESLLKFLYHHYDLVLGFNYETWNTTVRKNAEGLQLRFREAGFRVGDQQLDLIVHSMGGIVSRYFIEKLGGSEMVRRLIMCGTPNAGSPLTAIKNGFFLAGSLILNAIPVVGWGISALSFIFSGVSSLNMLDSGAKAMKPGSDFLDSLNDGMTDPKRPYTILVGNTSMIEEEDEKLVGRLMNKLGIGDPDYGLIMNLIFKGPNDMAVSTESIRSVPEGRDPAPKAIEVPCNHFGYFAPDGALEVLKDAIRNF